MITSSILRTWLWEETVCKAFSGTVMNVNYHLKKKATCKCFIYQYLVKAGESQFSVFSGHKGTLKKP